MRCNLLYCLNNKRWSRYCLFFSFFFYFYSSILWRTLHTADLFMSKVFIAVSPQIALILLSVMYEMHACWVFAALRWLKRGRHGTTPHRFNRITSTREQSKINGLLGNKVKSIVDRSTSATGFATNWAMPAMHLRRVAALRNFAASVSDSKLVTAQRQNQQHSLPRASGPPPYTVNYTR